MLIYIVKGAAGYQENRYTWNVKAFKTYEEAYNLVHQLDTWMFHNGFIKGNRKQSIICPWDNRFFHNVDTGVDYEIATVELD